MDVLTYSPMYVEFLLGGKDEDAISEKKKSAEWIHYSNGAIAASEKTGSAE